MPAFAGMTATALARVRRLADNAVRYPCDACAHKRVRFGAFSFIVARHPSGQGHASAVDAHLHPVAGNGQIPVQRCHDREFYALVASTLPIVIVVSSELE